jgi:repressor LexA
MLNQTIRDLKKRSKLTAYNLSQKSGIPLPTLNKILSGETRNPKYDTLQALLNAFDYQLDFNPIHKKETSTFSEKESTLLSLYRNLSPDAQDFFNHTLTHLTSYEQSTLSHQKTITTRELPLYLLPASAGIGSFLDSDHYEFRAFPADTIPSEAKFAIRVTGDSMEPAYTQDDIVFIKPETQLNQGDIGIIIINNQSYIKQYRDQQFISFNPKYDPIVPTPYDHVRIAGKVLGKYSQKTFSV